MTKKQMLRAIAIQKLSVGVKMLDKQRQIIDTLLDSKREEALDLVENNIDVLDGLANFLSLLVVRLKECPIGMGRVVYRGKEE